MMYTETTEHNCMNKLKFIFFLKVNTIKLKMDNTMRAKPKTEK